MKKWIVVLALIGLGCGDKTSLSGPELEYVKTTLALAKFRAKAKRNGADSATYLLKLDSVYKKYSTSRPGYLKVTDALATDPKRTELVYNALRDSMGIK